MRRVGPPERRYRIRVRRSVVVGVAVGALVIGCGGRSGLVGSTVDGGAIDAAAIGTDVGANAGTDAGAEAGLDAAGYGEPDASASGLRAVWASSRSDVWAVGADGAIT